MKTSGAYPVYQPPSTTEAYDRPAGGIASAVLVGTGALAGKAAATAVGKGAAVVAGKALAAGATQMAAASAGKLGCSPRLAQTDDPICLNHS